ncbi:hypothetical protein [Candidatus Accumulibacter sp. ACC012]|uniref:hypothetical protein n=1 Tax=Candidatus Accumulibacter sp. ACC012 TaxID=2823332 RepID=UPI0025BA702C|nr:hypothetical protein [Candidatus Accumulibacter sp. ACC012]
MPTANNKTALIAGIPRQGCAYLAALRLNPTHHDYGIKRHSSLFNPDRFDPIDLAPYTTTLLRIHTGMKRPRGIARLTDMKRRAP